jgi:hypothetical protein
MLKVETKRSCFPLWDNKNATGVVAIEVIDSFD